MDIAAGRQLAGVEVGMGIEPEHAQALACFTAVARHRADRTQAQAVVATELFYNAPIAFFCIG